MVTRDQLGERYGTAEHRGLAYAVSGAPGWGRKAVRETDASLHWSQPRAVRGRGAVRVPRYCAEHRHEIPGFQTS